MKVKVSDIAVINRARLQYEGNFQELQYIDTGSVTKGKFDTPLILRIGEDDIPSRAQRAVQNNTILISSVRPNLCHFGILKNPDKNVIVSSGFVTVDVIEEKVDADYLYYVLSSARIVDYLCKIADSSTSSYPSFNPEDLSRLEIEIPDSIDAQRKIAVVLASIDAKINNNNAICSQLEGMAKLIYEYWFIQCDFPNETGKPYKSNDGKMVWNEELKRDIPEGWEIFKLADVCNTLLGGTPDTKNDSYWNGTIPWLNSSEVAHSPVLASEKTITELGMKESTTSFAKAGAVVMSITRYIRPSILGMDSCFNQSVVAVIPNKKLHTSYLYLFMLSQVDRYMKLRTGAQQPHINKEIVDSTLIPIPQDTILNQFYCEVEPLFARQMIAEKENAKLESLRNFLLPMLMNGQVKVKGA